MAQQPSLPPTTYQSLFASPVYVAQLAANVEAYLAGYQSQGEDIPAPTGLRNQTVYRSDRIPMAFLCLLPRDETQVVLLVHRFMRFLDVPGKEPTGIYDTVIGLLGDIRPGMLPAVEIPGSALHLATANGVRVLTVAAMTVIAGAQDPLPHLLGPFLEGDT